jgi:hypothetical protein
MLKTAGTPTTSTTRCPNSRRIDGYELVIFNDCNQVDYVDSALAPDGRRGDFDDRWNVGEEPVDLLTDEEQTRLEALMEEAAVIP